jgi:L-asparaginase/Glu-tRNA(Gln) amidotransferase subunit D
LVLGAGGMPRRREKALDKLAENGVSIYIKSQCIHGNVENIYRAHTGVKKYTAVNKTSVDWAMYGLIFDLI